MVQHGDPHAVLLLYHFYRAVLILLPAEKYWWAQKRAAEYVGAVKIWLAAGSF